MIRIERVDGRWQWIYKDPHKDVELVSNEDYDSRDDAVAAARRAYPDVVIEETGWRGSRRRAAERGGREQEADAVDKIARWLALVVVLIAWSRRGRGPR